MTVVSGDICCRLTEFVPDRRVRAVAQKHHHNAHVAMCRGMVQCRSPVEILTIHIGHRGLSRLLLLVECDGHLQTQQTLVSQIRGCTPGG